MGATMLTLIKMGNPNKWDGHHWVRDRHWDVSCPKGLWSKQ